MTAYYADQVTGLIPAAALAGSAPVDAQYVVLGLNATLTNETVLAVGTGLNLSGATISIASGYGLISGGTSPRVPYYSSTSALTSSAGFEFASGVLTVPSRVKVDSSLTGSITDPSFAIGTVGSGLFYDSTFTGTAVTSDQIHCATFYPQLLYLHQGLAVGTVGIQFGPLVGGAAASTYGYIVAQRARTGPAAVQNGDVLMRVEAQGYDASIYAAGGNYSLVANGTWTTGSHPTDFRIQLAPPGSTTVSSRATFTGTATNLTPAARSAVLTNQFLFTSPAEASAALTAGANSIDQVKFDLAATVQFAALQKTNQYGFAIYAPTYAMSAGVAGDEIVDSATFYVSGAPIAGTNVVQTRAWAGILAGKVYLNINTPTATHPTLALGRTDSGFGVDVSPRLNVYLSGNTITDYSTGIQRLNILLQHNVPVRAVANSLNGLAYFRLLGAADTGLVASTNIQDVLFDLTRTKQHATGAGPARQSDFEVLGATHSAIAASTYPIISNVYVSNVGQGTNMTITDAAALHVSGTLAAGAATRTWAIYVSAGDQGIAGNLLVGSVAAAPAFTIESAGTLGVTGATTLQAAVNLTARVAKTFANTPYATAATDYLVSWDTSGGLCVQTLPVAVTGRVLIIKTTAVGIYTLTVTPNGAETIDGAANSVIAAANVSLTLYGVTGVGWIII